MKFEYDGYSEQRECVAYIDYDGDLIFNDTDHCNMGGHVYVTQNGRTGEYELGFNPTESTHKFYPGDKLTITF